MSRNDNLKETEELSYYTLAASNTIKNVFFMHSWVFFFKIEKETKSVINNASAGLWFVAVISEASLHFLQRKEWVF